MASSSVYGSKVNGSCGKVAVTQQHRPGPRSSGNEKDRATKDVVSVPRNGNFNDDEEEFQMSDRRLSRFEATGEEFTDYLRKELTLAKRRNKLYDYQIRAVLDTRDYYIREGTKAQPALIVAPTGAGKSGMVAMLPYVLKSTKVLILSPSLKITEQLAKTFGNGRGGNKKSFYWESKILSSESGLENFLEYAHVIRDSKDFFNTNGAHLVIVNAQKFGGQAGASLVHRNEEVVRDVKEAFKSFDTLIVDEAHHYPATTWENIVKQFDDKRIIFLTATPYRKGSKGEKVNILGPLQKITHEIKKEALLGRTIRKNEFDEFPTEDPYESKKSIFGNGARLQEIGNQIRDILKQHDQQDPTVNHKAMVIVYTKKEAKMAAAWLGGAIEYTSDKDAVGNEIEFCDDPELRILVTCGKLVEGYNNPHISVSVILRNVTSSTIFSQFVGRSLRIEKDESPIVSAIRSLPCFKQRKMWEQYENILPDKDPEDEDDVVVDDDDA